MAGKRRFVGPDGAVFVPNVSDDTIDVMVAKGEWTPVETKPDKPKATKKATKK